MGFVQSKSVYKGAETWPKATGLVGIGITLYEVLSIRGPSVTYHPFSRKDPWELNVGVRYFNDNRPWMDFSNHEEDYRNQRGDSVNSFASLKYKFGLRNKFFFGLSVEKELIEHYGWHTEASAGVPLVPYTSLSGTYSFAGGKSNKYAYGPEAVNGEGFFSLGLKVVFPHLPWPGIAMILADKSWILQDENKNADYVRGHSQNFVLSTRVIWSFY